MDSTPYQSSLDPLRAVVIDPSERVRSVFREALSDHDCELVFASDGFDALGKMDDAMPSIVFVSTHLPRLDGYRVAHIVRNNSRMRHVPVVLMSHEADLFERARGRLVGANEHMVGPLVARTVIEIFDRLVD